MFRGGRNRDGQHAGPKSDQINIRMLFSDLKATPQSVVGFVWKPVAFCSMDAVYTNEAVVIFLP